MLIEVSTLLPSASCRLIHTRLIPNYTCQMSNKKVLQQYKRRKKGPVANQISSEHLSHMLYVLGN
jgi:hypothetical protein